MSPGAVDVARNARLLEWYHENARPVPWRGESDPYRILVSEVMSQQTQLGRVVPAYESFIERFPTADALAGAPLADILEAWSGLGYNNRAVRLREAARQVAAEGWPDTIIGLLSLPGVGPYTAHAIASFAHSQPVAAIDTNLRRVLSRWYGEPLSGRALQAAADSSIADDSAAWNQAVMELGAQLCRPRDPHCDSCPVTEFCAGPDVYRPPRPQARFEGSTRQIRGEIVRSLINAPVPSADLARTIDHIEYTTALEGLIDDGIVVEDDNGSLRLAD